MEQPRPRSWRAALLDEMIAAVGAVEKRGAEKLHHYTEKLLHYTDHAVLLYVLTS